MCALTMCAPDAGTPYDCNEVRQFDRMAGDGDYSVLVNGFTVRVYCHNMNETQPLTYVNVRPATNYAEVYNKRCAVQMSRQCAHTNRLLHPFTCPYGGARNDSCACSTDRDGHSGRTVFERIRVDLHNMKVNGTRSVRGCA